MITKNKYIQNSVEALIELGVNDNSGQDMSGKSSKVLRSINRQRNKIKRHMQTAPFWRLADKFCFVIGSFIIISYSYIIGKYPNDLVFSYVSIVLPALILSRCWHYYS